MNSTDPFESTPDMDVRGRSESIPDAKSPEVQEQARHVLHESKAQLWKQCLTTMPTIDQMTESILIHGLRQILRSSLTHFRQGKPCEYFVGDDVAVTIREHHDHFDAAGDEFCTELSEPPAEDPRMSGTRRCGFQIEAGVPNLTMVNGQGDSMFDFGIVRWHEIPAMVSEAVRMIRTMTTPDDLADALHVHDGVYCPKDVEAHCQKVRAEIQERQKDIIDIPV